LSFTYSACVRALRETLLISLQIVDPLLFYPIILFASSSIDLISNKVKLNADTTIPKAEVIFPVANYSKSAF